MCATPKPANSRMTSAPTEKVFHTRRKRPTAGQAPPPSPPAPRAVTLFCRPQGTYVDAPWRYHGFEVERRGQDLDALDIDRLLEQLIALGCRKA